jgi:hypothetical protein
VYADPGAGWPGVIEGQLHRESRSPETR